MKIKFEKKDLKKNLIYIVTCILLILLVVLIVLAVRGKGKTDKSKDADDKMVTVDEGKTDSSKNKFQENAYPEVNALVAQYFNACASNDVAVLNQIVSSISDADKTIIQRKSEYIENYNEITAYTKLCPQEGSYLVFATHKIKFVNKDILVPGLETLYIRTADDGKMYIYGGDVEPEVSSYINSAVNSADAVALINKVNDEYVKTLASNADILSFIEKFEGNSELIERAKNVAKEAANAQTKEASDAAAKAEQDAAEKAAKDAQAASDAAAQSAANAPAINEKVAVTSTVNVRQNNDENSAKIGSVTIGETVTRISITDNGWSKIQFSGGEGYVKTDYVSTYKLTGDTVKATTAVNVRKECSETADMSGQLALDGTYKRNATYDNGWSQIILNGVVGYVKSEYLTN